MRRQARAVMHAGVEASGSTRAGVVGRLRQVRDDAFDGIAPAVEVRVMTSGQVFAAACGAALVLLGVVLLAGGGVSLPTRDPAVAFRFDGLALVLLALAPMLAGGVVAGVATGRLGQDGRWTRAALLASMAAVALAFVLAPKL